MPDRNSCLFCKIANKEIEVLTVYEDKHVLAFLDTYPITEGHTLIIPKVHAATLLDLPEEEIKPFFLATKRVLGVLVESFKTKTLTLGINHGEAKGIPHLHVHILPRFSEDGGKVIQSLVHMTNQRPIVEIHEQIVKTAQKNKL